VGFKVPSGSGNFNVAITNCKGDNLHSLAQLTGTTGATITNDTVTNSESFVNVSGGASTFNVSNCKFTTSINTGYGVRENGTSTAVINLENNEFLKSGDVLVMGKGTQVTAGTINVTSGIYTGTISKTAAATGTFVFTGGTFNQDVVTVQSYCAPYYTARDADPEPGYCTVRKDTVAMIGTQDFPTLQMALDTAYTRTGDVTINIVSDSIKTYSIVHQKAGLNLTIEGNNHKVQGQIIIDGDGRASGTETLTIRTSISRMIDRISIVVLMPLF